MEQCVSVTSVRVLEGYRLELTFSDNVRGTVDLTDRIVGRRGVFKALEDQQLFRQVRIHPELGTIVWPNEADICPELLHDWVTKNRAPVRETEVNVT